MGDQFDFLFKYIIIGDTGVGKSSLLHRFIERSWKEDQGSTIGVEFGSEIIQVGGKRIKLQVWDTAGQERFRSVTRSYYRGAAGALLVYDLSNRATYNHVVNWLADARNTASQDLVIMLVGNKSDLSEAREVTFMEASLFASENELMFLETSAKSGDAVDEAFLKCARTILNKVDTGMLDIDAVSRGIQVGTRTGAAGGTAGSGSSGGGCAC